MYKLNADNKTITRLTDMASIPVNPFNSDYRDFLKWVNEGNNPQPAFSADELFERTKQDKLKYIEDNKFRYINQKLELEGKFFDADYENILGAVIAALVDAAYTTPWVTADNQVVTLNSVQIQALGQLLKNQKTEAVIRARNLKNRLAAATTIEELELIVW